MTTAPLSFSTAQAALTHLEQNHDVRCLLPEAHDLSTYNRDWRGRYQGQARMVLQPSSTEAVAACVQVCAAMGWRMVVQGGNTGLVGGGVPDSSASEVVISLRRMQRIRWADPLNGCLCAEAGCTLSQVQTAAQELNMLFPLSLASEGSCTIGGNLATNAGGTQVLRYGNARDLCLGLEAVGADGHIWHGLKALRKDNTGYDLKHLLMGSEGTLAIITAASLKLFAQPARVHTALAQCHSLQQAGDLLMLARQQLGPLLTGFEVMNAQSSALVKRYFPEIHQPPARPWTILLEWEQHGSSNGAAETQNENLWALAIKQGCANDAMLAQDLAQAHTMWQLRERISEAQSREGLNVKHDISLPISRIADFCQHTDAALQKQWPGLRLVNFGHMGDGNLHYNVQAPEGENAAHFLQTNERAINQLVFDAVQAHDGSFSAEHGIGWLKRNELATRSDPVALGWMHRIKTALDPHNRFGPGRLLHL